MKDKEKLKEELRKLDIFFTKLKEVRNNLKYLFGQLKKYELPVEVDKMENGSTVGTKYITLIQTLTQNNYNQVEVVNYWLWHKISTYIERDCNEPEPKIKVEFIDYDDPLKTHLFAWFRIKVLVSKEEMDEYIEGLKQEKRDKLTRESPEYQKYLELKSKFSYLDEKDVKPRG